MKNKTEKLMALGLTLTLISSIAAAMPKRVPQTYEVSCHLEDDRDGDETISNPKFTFHRNGSKTAAYTENFKVRSTEHELRFQLGYDDEDDLIWIGLGDVTSEFSTLTYDQDPRKLNVFLNSQEFCVTASCTFSPVKRKKNNE
ncbi:MAG: hypothetical protein IT286_03255 [Proteobacteria bacterium]|jgi:hypothetical protein|nr:hypothetical protein [Pseudomonadota bacterium]